MKEEKTVREVFEILEKTKKDDTKYSKEIFNYYEEGKQDKKIKEGSIAKNRRDWLIIADIYNNGKYTQKFHLENYIKFKLKNNDITESDIFSYSYIRNAALVLYIREVIYNDDVSKLSELYNSVKEFYKEDDLCEKINKAPNLRK